MPGWQYRLEASYSGSGRPGDYAETLTLHTSDTDRETIPVRVSIHQVSHIRVAPEILHLKPDPATADFVGTVYLDDTEGASVEVQPSPLTKAFAAGLLHPTAPRTTTLRSVSAKRSWPACRGPPPSVSP